MLPGLALRAAVLTAAMLAAMLPAAAASADDEPPIAHWRGTECATGKLTHAAIDLEDSIVVVFGSAALCSSRRKQSGEFAVATFRPGARHGVITMSAIRRHQPGSRARSFGVDVGWAPRLGVCLLASPTQRIACAEVTIDAGDKLRYRPISNTDPLVARPVDPLIEEDGEPSCNSCF